MIPQTTTVFKGTIRSNLDPENEFTDEQIWEALSSCNLKEFVSDQVQKLEYEVNIEGANLSLGQKQLLCIAAAVLRKPKCLIFDESTAATDTFADTLIQELVKTVFRATTVISIAHRIASIIDFDRVMVLAQGELKEFDSPSNLIQNEGSLFKELYDSSGFNKRE
jgi:ATP-binding cassette subfamily C (CFTR/MRP) protein 5